MPPKRKTNGTTGPAKKAKVVPSADQFEEFYGSVLSEINELMDDENERPIVGAFVKLPSRKFYADYYHIIKKPISINEISKKLSRGEYSTADTGEFLADFKLLLENASSYNDPESWIVQDATKLYDFVDQQVEQFESGSWNEEITSENLAKEAEGLINDLMDHEFPEIGVISGPFIEDIDKKEYPDYFKIIKNPTSFNKLLSQLDLKIIKPNDPIEENLTRFYDATNLIFSNAQTYNDPSSLIHQDSLKLKEYFEEKFNALKTKALASSQKADKQKEDAKVKQASKRAKKKATPEPVAEPEVDESDDMEDVKQEGEEDGVDETGEESEEAERKAETPIPALESNVMGKTNKLGASDEVFIQEAVIGSVPNTIPQIVAQTKEFNSYRASQPASRYQIMKDSVFSPRADPISTLFEYKLPANGYCNQTYTLTLPSDSSSFVSLKFCLHDYLYSLKQADLQDGVGISELVSNDDFQCKLFVNDDEVDTTAEVDEEKLANERRLLRLQYDLKLSYGLNVLTFECKVAPNVSKAIRKSTARQEESEEIAGRHTRHQIQQMKMSWEVEKFNLYVICNSL